MVSSGIKLTYDIAVCDLHRTDTANHTFDNFFQVSCEKTNLFSYKHSVFSHGFGVIKQFKFRFQN